MCFKLVKEALHSQLGGPILAGKAMRDNYYGHVQVEYRREGGIGLLLGLGQER